MSVWEWCEPEGTPLRPPRPDELLPLDPEKARMRALTDLLEDEGEGEKSR